MDVAGAGILGIAGKSLSTAGKLSRLRKIPKTVYHGGRASVEKGTASRRGIYSTPDIKYAKSFADENRGFKGAKGPAGVYQLDLRSAKNIELLDKPSRRLRKIVSAKIKELKNISPNKITNYQQNLKDGLEFLFKKGKNIYVRGGGPTMVSEGTLNFLRKHGVEILSDSKAATHKLGKQSEFFLLKDFPIDVGASSQLGPFTINSNTQKVDTRARGRLANIKIENTAINETWRFGTFRADVNVDGRR